MNKLTKKQQKELKKIIKDHAKEAKKHFTEDGWDLRYAFIESSIYCDLLGSHIENLIFEEFKDFSGVEIKKTRIGDHALVFSLREPAVFYRANDDKIIVRSSYRNNDKLTFLGPL